MKRTTIFIDERLERELQAIARRQGQPVAALVREAVARYVLEARGASAPRPRFVAAGASGHHDVAERHEDVLFQTDVASARQQTKKRSRRIGLPRPKARGSG